MINLIVAVGFLTIAFTVVLIPLAFYEANQPSDYNEFYPVEYK